MKSLILWVVYGVFFVWLVGLFWGGGDFIGWHG